MVSSTLVDIMSLYFGLELNAGLIMQGYFKEIPHFLVGRVLVIGRLLRLGSIVHCILVVWLNVAGPLRQCVTCCGVVNISVCLSLCTEEEQRGVLRFLWAECVKGAEIRTFCELSMETTLCLAEVYMNG